MGGGGGRGRHEIKKNTIASFRNKSPPRIIPPCQHSSRNGLVILNSSTYQTSGAFSCLRAAIDGRSALRKMRVIARGWCGELSAVVFSTAVRVQKSTITFFGWFSTRFSENAFFGIENPPVLEKSSPEKRSHPSAITRIVKGLSIVYTACTLVVIASMR